MLTATGLALASAVLHAGWNLGVKASGDRTLTSWGMFITGGLLSLPVLVVIGPPGVEAVPFLAASAVVHTVYALSLSRAYEHGDFSVAYPLARGGGALVAGVAGAALLGDVLTAPAWAAIAVVVGGLVSLARPPVTRVALAWAGLTAATIGVYTTLDAAGARHSSSGLAYGIAVGLADGSALTGTLLAAGRGRAMLASVRTEWRRYALGGLATVTAYSMVLTAVRLAPVGYVAALRESSVVLGAVAGWLLLGEGLGRRRVASSVVVASGLALLIAWR
jgi:uncharacterized membrane protein